MQSVHFICFAHRFVYSSVMDESSIDVVQRTAMIQAGSIEKQTDSIGARKYKRRQVKRFDDHREFEYIVRKKTVKKVFGVSIDRHYR